MFKKLTSLLLMLVVTLGGYFYLTSNSSTAPVQDNYSVVAEASPLPSFNLKNFPTNDSIHSKSLISDKPLFINFWATWCPPCVGELPLINEAYNKYQGKVNFAVININNNHDDFIKFLGKSKFTFPTYYANDQEIFNTFRISGIPASYLIDSKGTIIKYQLGSFTADALNDFLQP